MSSALDSVLGLPRLQFWEGQAHLSQVVLSWRVAELPWCRPGSGVDVSIRQLISSHHVPEDWRAAISSAASAIKGFYRSTTTTLRHALESLPNVTNDIMRVKLLRLVAILRTFHAAYDHTWPTVPEHNTSRGQHQQRAKSFSDNYLPSNRWRSDDDHDRDNNGNNNN